MAAKFDIEPPMSDAWLCVPALGKGDMYSMMEQVCCLLNHEATKSAQHSAKMWLKHNLRVLVNYYDSCMGKDMLFNYKQLNVVLNTYVKKSEKSDKEDKEDVVNEVTQTHTKKMCSPLVHHWLTIIRNTIYHFSQKFQDSSSSSSSSMLCGKRMQINLTPWLRILLFVIEHSICLGEIEMATTALYNIMCSLIDFSVLYHSVRTEKIITVVLLTAVNTAAKSNLAKCNCYGTIACLTELMLRCDLRQEIARVLVPFFTTSINNNVIKNMTKVIKMGDLETINHIYHIFATILHNLKSIPNGLYLAGVMANNLQEVDIVEVLLSLLGQLATSSTAMETPVMLGSIMRSIYSLLGELIMLQQAGGCVRRFHGVKGTFVNHRKWVNSEHIAQMMPLICTLQYKLTTKFLKVAAPAQKWFNVSHTLMQLLDNIPTEMLTKNSETQASAFAVMLHILNTDAVICSAEYYVILGHFLPKLTCSLTVATQSQLQQVLCQLEYYSSPSTPALELKNRYIDCVEYSSPEDYKRGLRCTHSMLSTILLAPMSAIVLVQKQCAVCHKTATSTRKLYLCSQCKTARYCGTHCQHIDWCINKHKDTCRLLNQTLDKKDKKEDPRDKLLSITHAVEAILSDMDNDADPTN